MLRTETVTPWALELLKKLMRDEQLQDFFLVGGTALSLHLGHRMSIDLDLFSIKAFDENKLLDYLQTRHGFILDSLDNNTIKGKIENVAVDLITHSYPLIKELVLEEEIRLASLEDIAAMKLNAIMRDGTRLKDFIDVAYLSSHISLKQMIQTFEGKYSSSNPIAIIKSLMYHDEINFNEPIKFLKGVYQWKLTETRIGQMVESPDKVFPPLSAEIGQKKVQSKRKGLRP